MILSVAAKQEEGRYMYLPQSQIDGTDLGQLVQSSFQRWDKLRLGAIVGMHMSTVSEAQTLAYLLSTARSLLPESISSIG